MIQRDSSTEPTAATETAATETEVRAVAARARAAAIELAPLTRGAKDEALHAMADAVLEATDELLRANTRDVDRARRAGTPEQTIDRLALSAERIAAMAQGLRDVAALPDPVGEVVRGYNQPNGLEIKQLRVPLGVVAIVYEARPNVTVDAAGLALKSGNAALLRGSASAYESNSALIGVLAEAAVKAGLPENCVQLVPGTDRSSVGYLLGARGLVDVIIPRGGAGLIQYVVDNSSVPVIETGTGNVHVYVDAGADLELAEKIVLNSKISRPSVCNSAESLLVHQAVAAEFCPGSPLPCRPVASSCTATTASPGSMTRCARRWTTTGGRSTSHWTSPPGWWPTSTRRSSTSAAGPPATPRRS